MNVDITYHHTGTFRLAVYTRHAQLTELSTDRAVDIDLKDLPTVRGLSADGMRALIEAKQLPVAPAEPAPEPKAGNPAIGDIWLTRRGTYAAIVYGRIDATASGRLLVITAVELVGPHPRTFEVDKVGSFIGKGTGERHPLDLQKRDKGFL